LLFLQHSSLLPAMILGISLLLLSSKHFASNKEFLHPKLAFPGTEGARPPRGVGGLLCPLSRLCSALLSLCTALAALSSRRAGWDLPRRLLLWHGAGPGPCLTFSPMLGLEVVALQKKGEMTSGSPGKDGGLLQQLPSLTVVGAVVLILSQ